MTSPSKVNLKTKLNQFDQETKSSILTLLKFLSKMKHPVTLGIFNEDIKHRNFKACVHNLSHVNHPKLCFNVHGEIGLAVLNV